MLSPMFIAITILLCTIFLFLYGRWRHDIVAVTALLLCSLFGLITPEQSFSGFSHPAVVTVACILVLSYALQQTGVVDALADRVLPKQGGFTRSLLILLTLGAFLSSFMNNVGALALLMPISIQMAQRHQLSSGQVLMPLAFATILGGMITLIGTPSNLIVSSFRTDSLGQPFSMFSFTPVGGTVAVVGILFISFIGWRFIPLRQQSGKDAFETNAYLTEARVNQDSKAVGMRFAEAQKLLKNTDTQILGIIRNDTHLRNPNPALSLRADDVLLLEAEPDHLAKNLELLGMVFHEDRTPSTALPENQQEESSDTEAIAPKKAQDNHTSFSNELSELAIMPGSSLIGRSVANLRLRSLYHINVLAISRQGVRSRTRLRTMPLRIGDVLLVQGPAENVGDFTVKSGCVPLASRSLRVPDKRNMLLSASIMLLSVGLAAAGLLSAATSFMLGVLLLLVLNVVAVRHVYQAVDWSVIILLGAMIPVAQAMENTGAATLIANGLVQYVAQGHAVLALVVIMIATMLLSDAMNNAATAAVMSPVALGIAKQLEANPDSFLIVIVIGASAAFLTPIGHQNNTIILGPAGFKFSDYWRMGLPLDCLIVLCTIPLVLWLWPLY